MIQKVIKTIEKYQMPLRNSHVIAAISGGSDSVALLYILLSLQSEYQFHLTAAHVNHGIRGEEANRDENFVRVLCERLGVPCVFGHFDIPTLAKEAKESIELCGRRVRYEFFHSIDKDAFIATAHHADDAAETFFFNLTHGTGLKGLCGIPPVRDQIFRPLIECTKEEILAYCYQKNLSYVEDSSNNDNRYARNLIRHTVLPALKQINPAFSTVFMRNLSLLKEDEEYLSAQTNMILKSAKDEEGFLISKLSRTPEHLLNRVLNAAVYELSSETAEAFHIFQIRSFLEKGGSETICKGKVIRSDGKHLFLYSPSPTVDAPACIVTEFPFQTEYLGKELLISFENIEKSQKIYKEYFYSCIDCDKIESPIEIRTRKTGDAFRPAGRGMTKTLKKLFIEKKLTAKQKAETIVIADKKGILCVEGYGIDERVALKNETKNRLYITIRSKSS